MAYGRIKKSDGSGMALVGGQWMDDESAKMRIADFINQVKAPGRWEGGVDNGVTVEELLNRMPQGDAPNVIRSQPASQSQQFDMRSPIDYMGRKGFRQADGRIVDADGTMIADLNGVAKMQAQQRALELQDAMMKRQAMLADLMEKNQKIYAGTPEGMREKARIEAEGAAQKETLKAQSEAAQQLPKAEMFAQTAKERIEALIGKRDAEGNLIAGSRPHAGFEDAVGATWKPYARLIDGTNASDFMSRLNEVQGGAFLQAFEALKGGGAITEIEGQKATQALNRMNKSQSEAEFVQAARDFIENVERGLAAARKRSGVATPTQPAQAATLQPGTRKGGYVFIGGDPAQPTSWKPEK